MITPQTGCQDDFRAALMEDDLNSVSRLVRSVPEIRAAINQPLPGAPYGALPLNIAAQRGSMDIVDELLHAGADINRRTEWWAGGWGVLDECDPKIASYLISKGAVLDLHSATRLGMLDEVQAFVRAERDAVGRRGPNGQTPLHAAPTVEIARCLVAHGAPLDARDLNHESTSAQHMVRRKNARHHPHDRQEVVRYLIDEGCQTDILMAAALGDARLLSSHLESDPSSVFARASNETFPVTSERSEGVIYIWTLGWYRNPHVVAKKARHHALFDTLLDRSPLWLRLAVACELGDRAAANDLLARNSDLALSVPPEHKRMVADAAQNNNGAAVRLMLEAGWPADARGHLNATVLHWAAWQGNPQMVRDVLQFKPPLETRGEAWNRTPLEWARYAAQKRWHKEDADYPSTIAILLEAGTRH